MILFVNRNMLVKLGPRIGFGSCVEAALFPRIKQWSGAQILFIMRKFTWGASVSTEIMSPFIRHRILGFLLGVFLTLGHPIPVFAAEDHESGSGSGSESNAGSGSGSGGDSGNQSGNEDGGSDQKDSKTPTTTVVQPSPSAAISAGATNSPNILFKRMGRVVDQDEALKAISSGKAVTLPLLLAYMANKYPGEIVDIKLWTKDNQYVYEVKILSNAINLKSVVLDAKTLGNL
jgi:hypothetical protein